MGFDPEEISLMSVKPSRKSVRIIFIITVIAGSTESNVEFELEMVELTRNVFQACWEKSLSAMLRLRLNLYELFLFFTLIFI